MESVCLKTTRIITRKPFDTFCFAKHSGRTEEKITINFRDESTEVLDLIS